MRNGEGLNNIKKASGILLISRSTSRVFLALRSKYVSDPLVWGCPGGGVEPTESYRDAAIREFREEIGYDGGIDMYNLYTYRDEKVTYRCWLGFVDEEFEPILNRENDRGVWFPWHEIIQLKNQGKLHYGLERVIEERGDYILDVKALEVNKSLYEAIFDHKVDSEKTTLTEGITDIVYHYTKDPFKIFDTNEFMASVATGSDSYAGNLWFISTARSLSSSHMPSTSMAGATVLELNGAKLSQKYSGMPVEYWGDVNTSVKGATGDRHFEMEDRVFLNQPTIKNFDKYIKSIIIVTNIIKEGSKYHIPENSDYVAHVYHLIKGAARYSKNNGIELRLIPLNSKSYYKKISKYIPTISLDAALSLYENHINKYPPKGGVHSEIDEKAREMLYYALWYERYDLEHVNKILHLLFLDWIPRKWAGYGGEFDVIKTPHAQKYIYIKTSKFHNVKSKANGRVFLGHMLLTMKSLGLKSAKEEDFREFFERNYSWEEETWTPPFSRNDAPDCKTVESFFPVELRNKIEQSRIELRRMRDEAELSKSIIDTIDQKIKT